MKTKSNVKAGTKLFNRHIQLKLYDLNAVNLNSKLETIVKYELSDLFRVKLNAQILK